MADIRVQVRFYLIRLHCLVLQFGKEMNGHENIRQMLSMQ